MQATNQVKSISSLPVLRRGSTGDDVKYMQRLLNNYSSQPIAIDGSFGAKTEAAVKEFQQNMGLTVDGIVGFQTWFNLIAFVSPEALPVLRRGDKGYGVKFLQKQLLFVDLSLATDGVFGAKTEAAVKQFQKMASLTVDGIVGAKTWKALIGYQNEGCSQ